MTIDDLMKRLEWWKGQIGGGCEVKVTDGDGEYGFVLNAVGTDDEASETGAGNVLLIDTTGQQE